MKVIVKKIDLASSSLGALSKNAYGVRKLIKCTYSEFVDFISKELSNSVKYISKQRCDTLFYYLTERYKLYVEQFEE